MDDSEQEVAAIETVKEKREFDNVTVAMFVVGGIAVVGGIIGATTDSDPMSFLGTCVTAVGSLAGGIARMKNNR